MDVGSIYDVPLSYHEQGFDTEACRHFGLLEKEVGPDLGVWQRISDIVAKPEGMKIAIVGKYTSLLDSYKSLAEALTHGGIANKIIELVWIDSEIFESEDTVQHLEGVNGILVLVVLVNELKVKFQQLIR